MKRPSVALRPSRHVVEPSPSRQEHLGNRVLGLSKITRAAQCIGEDVPVLALEDPAEKFLALSCLHRCPMSG